MGVHNRPPASLAAFGALMLATASGLQHARIAARRHLPSRLAAAASVVGAPQGTGRDPRFAPPWITENEQLLAELEAASAPHPKNATASKSDFVGSIQTIEQFESALDLAHSRGRIAVVKWYAPWCRSCLNLKPLYESIAEKTSGEVADFYEVDASAARVLNQLANIEKMPTVHLYAPPTDAAAAGGQDGPAMALASMWLVESPPKFQEFTEGLIDLHLSRQDFT
jgi:thiol-disulfide isomerase/thioredoxin